MIENRCVNCGQSISIQFQIALSMGASLRHKECGAKLQKHQGYSTLGALLVIVLLVFSFAPVVRRFGSSGLMALGSLLIPTYWIAVFFFVPIREK